MNELIEAMAAARSEYQSALTRGMGVVVAKERMKNIAFNHYDQLIKALMENKSLNEEVDALDAALKEAEEELKTLKGKQKPTKSQE